MLREAGKQRGINVKLRGKVGHLLGPGSVLDDLRPHARVDTKSDRGEVCILRMS